MCSLLFSYSQGKILEMQKQRPQIRGQEEEEKEVVYEEKENEKLEIPKPAEADKKKQELLRSDGQFSNDKKWMDDASVVAVWDAPEAWYPLAPKEHQVSTNPSTLLPAILLNTLLCLLLLCNYLAV